MVSSSQQRGGIERVSVLDKERIMVSFTSCTAAVTHAMYTEDRS